MPPPPVALRNGAAVHTNASGREHRLKSPALAERRSKKISTTVGLRPGGSAINNEPYGRSPESVQPGGRLLSARPKGLELTLRDKAHRCRSSWLSASIVFRCLGIEGHSGELSGIKGLRFCLRFASLRAASV